MKLRKSEVNYPPPGWFLSLSKDGSCLCCLSCLHRACRGELAEGSEAEAGSLKEGGSLLTMENLESNGTLSF